MLETICTPYGKSAFPTVVKCDGCGERIYDGWMPRVNGDGFIYIDDKTHWCDTCFEEHGGNAAEFRVCDTCGEPMIAGFTNEGNGMGADFHACEECFDKAMDARYGDGCWRTSDNDDEGENGGYYDAWDGDSNSFEDTGIFYTEWY